MQRWKNKETSCSSCAMASKLMVQRNIYEQRHHWTVAWKLLLLFFHCRGDGFTTPNELPLFPVSNLNQFLVFFFLPYSSRQSSTFHFMSKLGRARIWWKLSISFDSWRSVGEVERMGNVIVNYIWWHETKQRVHFWLQFSSLSLCHHSL